ncbi:phage holin family protein, partial [bacterium]|nr:phage holin family protein [bacterium]
MLYLRILIRYLLVWAVNAASLALVTLILPGFWFDTALPYWWRAPLLLPVEFALLILTVRPLLVLATLPLNALTQGLPTLFINAGVIQLTAAIEPAFHIEGWWHALFGVAMITVINTSLTSWLGIDEIYPLFQTILRRLGMRYGPRARPGQRRGLLILQIDGLSWRSLMRAVRRGRMPAVSALLALGSHRLYRWQSGIPSNTPAVQGGLFYGTRSGVPGYRWYDRARDR